MARSKKSQSKHDREVKRQAKELKDKGFEVKADVSGFSRPETINGLRPDIVAERGKQKRIIEVETEDSVKSKRDLKQKEAFREEATQDKNTTFKRVIADRES